MNDGKDLNDETHSPEKHLSELVNRHRELDGEIERLQSFPYVDQLRMQRLKKQRLQLKETIERLRSKLIPDLDA